jgi:acyl-CoA reductase-like NAD-dependent aldehyde dehydrogenase/nicotinamidase-related amidase
MKPLLLLVDLQRDYLASAHLEPAAGQIVHHAAQLLGRCREAGVPVAHVWTSVSRDPDNRMPHWKAAGRWRCEEGTPGHEPPPPLAPRDGEAVIRKSVFSPFAEPALAKLIWDRAVDTLLVAGIHLHACVRQTALDAYQAGLAVWVAEDAVGSDDPIHAAITRRYLEARAVRFAPAAALAAQLAGPDEARPRGSPQAAVREAVGPAQDLARVWAQSPLSTRLLLIERLAALLAGRAGELAERMAGEIGKPVRFGRVEVLRTAEMLGAIARRFETAAAAETIGTASVRRRPHGVVAVITPWNNPVYLALGKIVPAVLFGNAVVWKPAPEAAGVSRLVYRSLAEAGWPVGLVGLLEGGRREGEALMSDPGVAAVTITGSSAAGYAAQEACARRRVPLQAELGGNNAAVVWTDADMAEAARLVAAGAFEMAGQRCTANRRVIVLEAGREPFLRLLLRESAALAWGDPLSDDTRIGPLVNGLHRDRVASVVERAVADCGPALLPHGPRPPAGSGDEGAWYPPTVVCCDDPAHEIVQEESFGPVLVVQTARDWDQAMRLCNGVRQGLAAAVFTGSRSVAERFLDEAEAGILKVNQSTADAAVDVPFGGWKASGLGPPEHGACDLEFYTRAQTVYGECPSAG